MICFSPPDNPLLRSSHCSDETPLPALIIFKPKSQGGVGGLGVEVGGGGEEERGRENERQKEWVMFQKAWN